MLPNSQFPADLVLFTEEFLNGKLHFLCNEYPCQWCVDQRKGIIFCERTDLQKFSSIRWLVGQMEEKVGFNFFLFQTFLLYNYSSLGSLFLRISINFSSAIKNNWDGIFISNPSFWLTALPWTIILHLFCLAGFRK